MITLLGYIQINEGKIEHAIKLVKELVKTVTDNEPGTITYKAYVSNREKDRDKIFFYEEYEDESAFKHHQENIKVFTSRFQDIIAEGGYNISKVNEIIS